MTPGATAVTCVRCDRQVSAKRALMNVQTSCPPRAYVLNTILTKIITQLGPCRVTICSSPRGLHPDTGPRYESIRDDARRKSDDASGVHRLPPDVGYPLDDDGFATGPRIRRFVQQLCGASACGNPSLADHAAPGLLTPVGQGPYGPFFLFLRGYRRPHGRDTGRSVRSPVDLRRFDTVERAPPRGGARHGWPSRPIAL